MGQCDWRDDLESAFDTLVVGIHSGTSASNMPVSQAGASDRMT